MPRNPLTNRQPSKPKAKREEQRFQIALVKLLRLVIKPGWIFWHTPNGERRDPVTAAILKGMGTLAGVFDLAFLGPEGSLFWLELKSTDGALSIEQQDFKAELEARGKREGIDYAIADNLEDAIAFLQTIGAVGKGVRLC